MIGGLEHLDYFDIPIIYCMYNIYIYHMIGALEHGFYVSIPLGMSSSQLTKSIIFQRDRYSTKQSRSGWPLESSV